MRLRRTLTQKLQKVLWIYLTDNFIISHKGELRLAEPVVPCNFIPITAQNCLRVRDFREGDHVVEFRNKLAKKEMGFFAECRDRMVGSIWATMNTEGRPVIARTYMPLRPNEALIHDIVTGEESRGKGVGPFMVGKLVSTLLEEYPARKIMIDVNVRNKQSLRMMEKVCGHAKERVLYVSTLGTLLFKITLRKL